MTKSVFISPATVRQSGHLMSSELPLNVYQSNPAIEAKEYGSEALLRMYHDMTLIREFETMLDRIKQEQKYEDIAYEHRGPAHLSIGQEATAVGQAYHLTTDDLIFGSHRSHGEILAKSLSAIAKLSGDDLLQIMKTYLGGELLDIVSEFSDDTPTELAINFALFGTLAEIFGRSKGFNRGMGGSMHAFFVPFGIMPNNAIVGGSAPIATGAALYKRVNRKPGMVIANIGDASSACGPVWESMVFSAMDQYRKLWNDDRGGLPILFNFMNNFYGMGGQTYGETMGFEILARIGLGVNPSAMHAERVDGYNPLAVADAIKRKKALLERGEGPALLDVVTYRYSGHSPSDASSYRERDEVERWREQDAIVYFGRYLIQNQHATNAKLQEMRDEVKKRVMRLLSVAISTEIAPYATESLIESVMFSNQPTESRGNRQSEVLLPIGKTRLAQTQAKHRFAYDANGNELPKLQCVTYAEALFEAMIHRFYQDPTMVAYGEENRDWGGAFGVYRGLTEALPYHRLFNAPIAEAAIVGSGVGYALAGGRAVVELMYADFMGRAGDELFNQMAKWQSMSAGVLTLPLVVRVSVGMKYGAQHSQDWSSLVAHIPGLKVYYPATPYDAKGMLNLALRGSDPVIFFESQRLYNKAETVVTEGVPTHYYEVPEGEPIIRRTGSDLTLVTLGATLDRALEAAEWLATQHQLSVEVIDLRFINPLNPVTVIESVKKTGRALLVSDACERGSFLHTVASLLTQATFAYLDAPITVVGSRNWITPPAELEELFFPQVAWIVDALHEQILPLEGHVVRTTQTIDERVRRFQHGV